MFAKKILNNQIFLIIFIFALALSVRLYGLNWDQGQHLHPDERFLTMIDSTIQLPKNLQEYFNTSSSPLNPYNYKDYQFFVYGTFPLFITKYLGILLNLSDYDHIHFIGRVLSVIFDSLNIFSLFFLSKLIFKENKKAILLPSLFYSLTVLPIQLSHFFAVDTFLCFFILLTFVFFSYWLYQKKLLFLIFASISFSLALSCKISAVLFLPIIVLFFIYKIIKNKKINTFEIFLFLIISFLTFRIFQPYAFIGFFKINPDFIESFEILKFILTSKDVFYPPEIQWLNRIPIIYPFINIIFFGLGLPIFLIFILSIKNLFKIKVNFIILNIIVWILFLLIEQGWQFTATMRYFLPVYPFICFLSALLVSSKSFNKKIAIFITIIHIIYCFAFLSIYSRPHSRIQSSVWIYQNIPPKSKIANEYWDDPLPLYLPNYIFDYQNEMLHFYDSDSKEKWQKINSILKDTNYLFMTSNRLWGSIPRVPDKYPITAKFYQDVFDEKLNFKKVLEINSYPGFVIPFLKQCFYLGPTNFPYANQKNKWFEIDKNCEYPGIFLRDDIAEEAFTIYDHPKVLIFKNTNL